MATSSQRSARVKKQLRDRRGRWIVMGGGITWTSASGTKYNGKATATGDGYVEVSEVRYKDVNGRTGALPQPARVDASKVDASPPSKARLDSASADRDEFSPVAEPADATDASRQATIGALDLVRFTQDERYAEDDTALQSAIASQNAALDLLGDPLATPEDQRAAVDVFYEDVDALRQALAVTDTGEPVDLAGDELDAVLGQTLDELDQLLLDEEDAAPNTADPLQTLDPADPNLLDSDVADPTDDAPEQLKSEEEVGSRGWLKTAAVGAQITFPGSDTTPPFIATKQSDGAWQITSRAGEGDSREGGLDNAYAPDDDFFDQFFPIGLQIEKETKR